jgi:succinoglycan biosynthesis transport protein ExoP
MERSDEYFRRHVRLLRRWAWLLVACSVLTGGGAYYFSQRIAPNYQASASLLISAAPDTAAADYSGLRAIERLAVTYAELATKDPVLEEVVRRLELGTPVEALEESIKVRPVNSTQLIRIQAWHGDPELAAGIANTLAEVFIEQNQALQASRYAATKANLEEQLALLDAQIETTDRQRQDLEQVALPDTGAAASGPVERAATGSGPADPALNNDERARLETLAAQYRQAYASLLSRYEDVRIAEAQSTSNIVVVEAAKTPRNPVSPDTKLNMLVGVLLGAMLGGTIAFGFELLNDKVRDPRQTSEQLDAPVLGLIASHDTRGNGPVAMAEPRAPVVEAFRALRTNLQFASGEGTIKTILVTSPSPGEGKSLVAANLAVVLAQGEQSVLLVDADLRRPSLHKIFGLNNRRGLSSLLFNMRQALRDNQWASQVTHTAGLKDLGVLTSGSLPTNPAELLSSNKIAAILERLRAEQDAIIVDSPPVLAVTDATVLAPRVDGVLLVIKPEATKMAEARDAVEQLRRVGANLLGVVFNDVDVRKSGYYYYKYKDYYYSGGKNGRLEYFVRAQYKGWKEGKLRARQLKVEN